MEMRWNCFSLQLHGMVRIFVDRWNAKIACYSILFHRNIIYSKCDAVSLWCRSMKLNSNQIIFAWHWVRFLFLCNMWHDSNLWNIVHSIPWCKTNVWIYKHLSISTNDCTTYWEKEWMCGCCTQHTYIEKSKVFTLCVCVCLCAWGMEAKVLQICEYLKDTMYAVNDNRRWLLHLYYGGYILFIIWKWKRYICFVMCVAIRKIQNI